jgi:tetratricopeptide (TPR) repeat protein
MQYLLANEATYVQASNFIQRVRSRIAADTPLRTKLDVSYAEEDLHRHTGNFDEAIAVRSARVELDNNPLISCYERMADSDNRHAAALYDAHRFTEAIQCLEPWLERFRHDPKICLPETRSFLFNTLGRCLVVLGDPRWEEMFDASLKIQLAVAPAHLSRTENSLIHGYLKCQRLFDAAKYLDKMSDTKDDFRVWLRAEHARQSQSTWCETNDQQIHAIDSRQHVFGFAMQAAARHVGRSLTTRIQYLQMARNCFLEQIDSNKSNVKLLFGLCCDLAIAITSNDDSAFYHSLAEFDDFCNRPGLSALSSWYEPSIRQLRSQRDWSSIESLFCRVPHL